MLRDTTCKVLSKLKNYKNTVSYIKKYCLIITFSTNYKFKSYKTPVDDVVKNLNHIYI